MEKQIKLKKSKEKVFYEKVKKFKIHYYNFQKKTYLFSFFKQGL